MRSENILPAKTMQILSATGVPYSGKLKTNASDRDTHTLRVCSTSGAG